MHALLEHDISAEDGFFSSFSAAAARHCEEEHLSPTLQSVPVSTDVIVFKVCIIV